MGAAEPPVEELDEDAPEEAEQPSVPPARAQPQPTPAEEAALAGPQGANGAAVSEADNQGPGRPCHLHRIV